MADEAVVEQIDSKEENLSKPKIKVCAFCTNKTVPTYTDTVALRRFMTGRGKIVAKQRSGVCSKHQRVLAREIKHARHLALLPFTLQV